MSEEQKNTVREIVQGLKSMDKPQQDAVLNFAAGVAAAARIQERKEGEKA